MDIKELNKLSVSHLKRLLKSRAGRIAELEVEVRVITAIIDQKIKNGDIETKTAKKERIKVEKPTEMPKSKIKTSSSDHAFEEID